MTLPADVLEKVSEAFEGARHPARAPAMKAYIRGQFDYLGLTAPERVALGREAIAGLPKPDQRDLIAVAEACWARDEREYQYFAVWYLRRYAKRLDAGFMPTARFLITTKSWWDTIDLLAQTIVGVIVYADRSLVAVMDEWIEDDDFWLARSAILHQTGWKADTDTTRLFGYCDRRAADTEFFIRKAIGWALREYSKTDEAAVRRYVADHDAVLSGLSKREALKWLERRAERGTAS